MRDWLKILAVIFIILVIFFYPVWLQGKVPLNGNFLVSFYAPWKYQDFEGFPTGVPAKQGGGYDTLRIGYPYFGMVHEGWSKGFVPLWNPYNFAGLPLAAETQSAAFYPLQFLSPIVSQINLWTIFTISGYFFCFLFTYLYLKHLTQHLIASIFGAFTFSFNTFFIAWNQEVVTAIHAAMWLPLMFLAVDKLIEAKKIIFWWSLLVTISALSILSGYMQVTMYVFIVSGFYTLWRFIFSFKDSPRNSARTVLFSLSAMVVSVLLTLFQTLPLYEMYTLSSRPIIDMKEFLISYLMPIYAPIQLFIPSFFGNSGTWNHYGFPTGTFYEHTFAVSIIAVIFALFTLLVSRSRDKYFFLAIGFFSLILTLDLPISRLVFHLDIPVLSSSIANRLLFVPPFSLAVLSAVGLKEWQKGNNRQSGLAMLVTLTLILITFAGIVLWVIMARADGLIPPGFPEGWTRIALRNSIIPGVSLVIAALLIVISYLKVLLSRPFHRYRLSVILIMLFVLSIFQMGYFFRKVTAFSPRRLIYPSHPLFEFLKQEAFPYRFLGLKGAFIDNNIATQMRVFTAEGYDSLANRRYAQLLKASETGGLWTDQLSRSDVGISKVIDKSFSANEVRNRILTLTSTKYILYRPEKERSYVIVDSKIDDIFANDFTFVKEVDGIKIYQYEKALPRTLLISKKYIAKSQQEIFNKLFMPEFEPRETLVLEKDVKFKTETDSEAKVDFELYQPNRVALRTKSKTPQWLLLTDAYYPGWRAFIDGKGTEIYRANFAFRAVPVPAGEHTVEFRYWPDSLDVGLKISLATFMILVIIAFFSRSIHSILLVPERARRFTP